VQRTPKKSLLSQSFRLSNSNCTDPIGCTSVRISLPVILKLRRLRYAERS
jgi:hypothetical protein